MKSYQKRATPNAALAQQEHNSYQSSIMNSPSETNLNMNEAVGRFADAAASDGQPSSSSSAAAPAARVLEFFSTNCSLANKKLPLTIIYCVSFWNFGTCVAIFGPTLLDLACQTSSTLSAMSLLYFMQNFTALIGCFVSGIVAKRNKMAINDILLVSTFVMLLSVALMPMAKHVVFLGFVMSLMGFCMGCIDNIANLAILKLHSNNVSPYIQTMHFFYGVGAFLTPIVVKSFLNANFDFEETSVSFTCYNIDDLSQFVKHQPVLPNTLSHPTALFNHTTLSVVSATLGSKRTPFSSRTKYAFWILAAIQLPAPIILLLLKLSPKDLSNSYNDIDQQQQLGAEGELSGGGSDASFSISYFKSLFSNVPVLQLTLLMSTLVFLFEGLQASHGGYIFSYTVEKYDMKESKFALSQSDKQNKLIVNRHHHHENDDAYITAMFWAFFSIGRLLSIFIATKFSASFMLLVDIVGCIVSAVIMLMSSMMKMISLLYLATCLLGLFLSNTTPTTYSMAEIHIGVTPTLTSFIIICAASGEMIVPLIVANAFESFGPTSLLVIELILSLCAAGIFVKFVLYAREHTKSFDARDSFIWLKGISADEANKPVDINVVGKTANTYYSKMNEESD